MELVSNLKALEAGNIAPIHPGVAYTQKLILDFVKAVLIIHENNGQVILCVGLTVVPGTDN